MWPLTQTIIDDNVGNCLATCVACILEISVESVPNFASKGATWRAALENWLKSKGRQLIAVEYREPGPDYFNNAWVGRDEVYVILKGISPRLRSDGKPRHHAVVGKPNGFGFKAIHDPHPSHAGLAGPPYGVLWIV